MNVFEILSTKYESDWLQGKISFKDENDGKGIVIDRWDMVIQKPSLQEIMSYEEEMLPIFKLNELKARVISLVESLLNNTATRNRYGSSLSCATYVNSTNPQWKSEAEMFVAWRDAVWMYCFEEFEKARNGDREIVSAEEFLAELPLINW